MLLRFNIPITLNRTCGKDNLQKNIKKSVDKVEIWHSERDFQRVASQTQ